MFEASWGFYLLALWSNRFWSNHCDCVRWELLTCWVCGSGVEDVVHKNHTLESSMAMSHGNKHVAPFAWCVDWLTMLIMNDHDRESMLPYGSHQSCDWQEGLHYGAQLAVCYAGQMVDLCVGEAEFALSLNLGQTCFFFGGKMRIQNSDDTRFSEVWDHLTTTYPLLFNTVE